MDALIIRSLQGKLSHRQEQRLRRWREAHPTNERRYQELRRLWTLSGYGASVAEEFPDTEELLERAEEAAEVTSPTVDALGAPEIEATRDGLELERSRPRTRGGPTRRSRIVGWGAAAAALVALGFGIAHLAGTVGGDPSPVLAGEIETGDAEMTTLTLSDGSSVRLGPRSHLRFRESEEERTLYLQGRAFFGVEHDPSREFVVETDYGRAVAVGTRFEVRTDREDFRVLTVDGRVAVSAGGVELELGEHEMSSASPGRRPSKSRVSDVYEELRWMGNHLVFRATPLRRAVEELERRYGVQVSIERPDLEDFPVTATFTGDAVEDVVLVLCEIARVRCEFDEDRIRIGTNEARSVAP